MKNAASAVAQARLKPWSVIDCEMTTATAEISAIGAMIRGGA